MLQDYSPSGGGFEFEGKTYTILPNVLCGGNMRQIKRHLKLQKKEQLQELLKTVAGNANAEQTIIKEIIKSAEPGPEEPLMAIMNDPQVAAILLRRSCPELASAGVNEAERVAMEYPNYFALASSIVAASGMDSLKNSIRRLAAEAQLPLEAEGKDGANQESKEQIQ